MGKMISFTLWVTTSCNMKCSYCYEGMEKNNINMTLETGIAAARWIAEIMRRDGYTFAQIRFHGGEPTINMPVIRGVIDSLRKIGKKLQFEFSLTSNGYQITRNDLDYLVSNIDELSISLDGTKEVNNICRKNKYNEGVFDKVFTVCKYLTKQKENIWIRMTVNDVNCAFLSDSIKFFLENGMRHIAAVPDLFCVNWTSEHVDILEYQCRTLRNYIKKEEIDCEIILPLAEKVFNHIPCGAGKEKYEIDVQGKIYPCSYVITSDVCMGDIYRGLNSNVVKNIKGICLQSVTKCVGCNGYSSCISTRCKFINKAVTGNYFLPIPLVCELHRREAKRTISDH